MTPEQLAPKIEHTNLRADATESDIRRTCREALEYGFGAVVVNPVWVATAAEVVSGSTVRLVTVAGFPLGASRTETKIVEAVRGAIDGAAEIDLVINLGRLRAGDYAGVEDEIAQVRRMLPTGTTLKVIIEASFFDRRQQVEAVRAVINGGAEFVKTGTGFQEGATVEQVQTLCEAAEGLLQVKAAGAIRTPQQCFDLLDAGAARLGCSASVNIMKALTS